VQSYITASEQFDLSSINTKVDAQGATETTIQADLDQAKTDIQALRTELDTAKADIDTAKADISNV
jgi:septal ring factor EnvC (AmiA/AmiB activator)|tara:strand:+ start:294 stop:491 length:198 start_codon:yes stop_codon:yes gene_type:complete